jgi:hypothetical protein
LDAFWDPIGQFDNEKRPSGSARSARDEFLHVDRRREAGEADHVALVSRFAADGVIESTAENPRRQTSRSPPVLRQRRIWLRGGDTVGGNIPR